MDSNLDYQARVYNNGTLEILHTLLNFIIIAIHTANVTISIQRNSSS